MIDNNGQAGNQFDIVAKNEVNILGFKIHSSVPNPDLINVEIYTKQGTHVGYDTNSNAWDLVDSFAGITSMGGDQPTELPLLSQKIPVDEGETRAFYITLVNVTNMRYTNGLQSVGDVYKEDDNLQILEGYGKSYPFGSTFQPRVWNGFIIYEYELVPGEPTTKPSDSPSSMPSASVSPSLLPSNLPSSSPSDEPSNVPSNEPSWAPSEMPSLSPSNEPSDTPSSEPSFHPTQLEPSRLPSGEPSTVPSKAPSMFPGDVPSSAPSRTPSLPPIEDNRDEEDICPLTRINPPEKFEIQPYTGSVGGLVDDDLNEISYIAFSDQTSPGSRYAYTASDKEQRSLKVLKFSDNIFGGTGTVVATYTLDIAIGTNDDWEAIAFGPCTDTDSGSVYTVDETCIYIGNIGNNRDPKRGTLEIFKFVEPVLDTESPQSLNNLPVATIEYTYGAGFSNTTLDGKCLFLRVAAA
jgi:hypothetical protein